MQGPEYFVLYNSKLILELFVSLNEQMTITISTM